MSDGGSVVLLTEDPAFAEAAARALDEAGFRPVVASSLHQGLESVQRHRVRVVVSDLALRDARGLEICRVLRGVTGAAIVLTSDAAPPEVREAGFAAGADDFLAKPVHVPELVWRVRRAMRLAGGGDQGDGALEGPAGIVLDEQAHGVSVEGVPVALTTTEFRILRLLLSERGRVHPPDDISSAVWGYPTHGSRNYVEAHISRLRAKLRSAGADNVILTVRGVGYTIR